jgi:hypothetical protein
VPTNDHERHTRIFSVLAIGNQNFGAIPERLPGQIFASEPKTHLINFFERARLSRGYEKALRHDECQGIGFSRAVKRQKGAGLQPLGTFCSSKTFLTS